MPPEGAEGAAVGGEAGLAARVALIACGQRPGKTSSCEGCARKAVRLLQTARSDELEPRLLVLLSTTLCGSTPHEFCGDCREKAAEILALVRRSV